MTGIVEQVSISNGGVPKRAIIIGELTENGFACDRWRYPFHGGRRRAVLLVTGETIDELVSSGFPIFPGAVGENLTTRGLERRDLRLGQRLLIGDATIQLTEIRVPCATLDVYGTGIQRAMYDARVQAGDTSAPRWGLSGFYAAVVQPGTVCPGDTIRSSP